eukprot:TRINITY_DN13587_c0_g1_i1.p1 TRINITY_DN13587_c0_g1~~TRINITY_DN13587_c0_g1_i1.p1  ORF type:complete len:461 (+),score=54.78 TRINITY_DN13587_c0_g1_i1:150-1385(+)
MPGIEKFTEKDAKLVGDVYKEMKDEAAISPSLTLWMISQISKSKNLFLNSLLYKSNSTVTIASPLHLISVLQSIQDSGSKVPFGGFSTLRQGFLLPSVTIIRRIFNNCYPWLSNVARLDIISLYLKAILYQLQNPDEPATPSNEATTSAAVRLLKKGEQPLKMEAADKVEESNLSGSDALHKQMVELRGLLGVGQSKELTEDTTKCVAKNDNPNSPEHLLTNEIYPTLWKLLSENHEGSVSVLLIGFMIKDLILVETEMRMKLGAVPEDSPTENFLKLFMSSDHRFGNVAIADFLMPVVLVSPNLSDFSCLVDAYYLQKRSAADVIRAPRVLPALLLSSLNSSSLPPAALLWWCSYVPFASCLGPTCHHEADSLDQAHLLNAVLSVVVTWPHVVETTSLRSLLQGEDLLWF